MTVDINAFRGAFPAFKDATKFPDGQVTFYLALAPKLHSEDRWGDLLDFGVQLWVAHNLSLDFDSQRQAAAGQNPGSVRGAVTSMSANGVSWARDPGAASDPSAGHWNLTQYGLRWKSLANMVGMGAVQVGEPTALELSLSDWPWPGVT